MNAPAWTPAQTAVLHAMHRSGATNRAIADALGKTTISVERKCIREGLRRPKPAPQPPVTPRERQQRLVNVITRINAPVPLSATLGDIVRVGGKQVTAIALNPDGELVCVDVATKEVIVVVAQ